MTEEKGPDGKLLPDEQRLTPLGKAIRHASIDELPQLWSVLRGEMSLVGPRPLYTQYTDRYSARQRIRLDVKPGITGWAQVNGRNALSWEERLELDAWYVEHQSLLLDAKIILKTFATITGRRGVSHANHATMHEFMGSPSTGGDHPSAPKDATAAESPHAGTKCASQS